MLINQQNWLDELNNDPELRIIIPVREEGFMFQRGAGSEQEGPQQTRQCRDLRWWGLTPQGKLFNIPLSGAYNLTVPNKMSRHASTTKLEEIHSDHIKIVGELENEEEKKNDVVNMEQSNDINDNKIMSSDLKSTASSSSIASSQTKESQESSSTVSSQSQGYATSSMSQQSMSSSTSMTSMTSMQRSETMSETRSVTQQQSSVETLQQKSTIQVSPRVKPRLTAWPPKHTR